MTLSRSLCLFRTLKPIQTQNQVQASAPEKKTRSFYAIWWNANVLTVGARRLEAVVGQVTPADGEDVPGEVLAPVIEGPAPAVERDEDLVSAHLPHGGGADQARVLSVHGFQLHAHFEVVLRRLERLLTKQEILQGEQLEH